MRGGSPGHDAIVVPGQLQLRCGDPVRIRLAGVVGVSLLGCRFGLGGLRFDSWFVAVAARAWRTFRFSGVGASEVE